MGNDAPPEHQAKGRPEVDLYGSSYGHFTKQVYAEVRRETWGEDIGQNSWLTAEELRRFAEWLQLQQAARVLEVACGSGGPALRLAELTGCEIVGIDIHEDGIRQAKAMARSRGLEQRAHFERLDANEPLPFADQSFDALLCIDAINHFPDRAQVLAEWRRVLRAGGRLLLTDPITVTGPLSNAEIAVRSAISFFLFVPPGENERQLMMAGLRLLRCEDLTDHVAQVAARWRASRTTHEAQLREIEGTQTYEGQQAFLRGAELLARERRLSRFAFLGERTA
jgi:ubiquinone/menaquinone biosynthesis C-methylase UbiE